MPFQQTARYCVYYREELTESEYEAINHVLDVDTIAEVYTPYISDPVKSTYNENASTHDLIAYFVTWAKMFFKHPIVYIEATMHQNYLLFDLFEMNRAVYYDPTGEIAQLSDDLQKSLDIEIREIESLRPIKSSLVAFWEKEYEMPLIGLLTYIGFYAVLLVYMLGDTIINRRLKWILVSLPSFITIINIILAPCIKYHPRYAFPLVYAFPQLLAYFISGIREASCHRSI